MATVRTITHELLETRGLTTMFGNPGSNELPFLAELPDTFDYVLGLHEGAVVGMADGYAQASGRPVVVNLHAASGTGNAMGALTNAASARTPMVVLAGQQVRGVIGMEGMLSNVDAATLTRPLTPFAVEPACAADVPRAISQAIFEATVRRAPTYVSIPYDDWSVEAPSGAALALGREVRTGRNLGEADIAWLAGELESATNPALVFGGDIDAQGYFDAAVALAEALACPVWAAPSEFRLPFPNRHPLFRGQLPAGIKPIADAFAPHDLVVIFGAPVFRYHQHVPGEFLYAGTRLIQITDDVGAATRAPMGAALVADAGPVIEALTGSVVGSSYPKPLAWKPVSTPATSDDLATLHPEQVFAALRRTQRADTVYVVESTSTKAAFWSQMDLRLPGSYYFPASGGLGFGLPAAVGVQLAKPGRPVVAVIGDGAANYGITGLWTAAQRHLPVTFVILRNGTYGALRWFAGMLGVPKTPGLDVPGIDFTAIARGYGVPAVAASGAGELADVLAARAAALAAAAPAAEPLLIQVDTAITDPE